MVPRGPAVAGRRLLAAAALLLFGIAAVGPAAASCHFCSFPSCPSISTGGTPTTRIAAGDVEVVPCVHARDLSTPTTRILEGTVEFRVQNTGMEPAAVGVSVGSAAGITWTSGSSRMVELQPGTSEVLAFSFRFTPSGTHTHQPYSYSVQMPNGKVTDTTVMVFQATTSESPPAASADRPLVPPGGLLAAAAALAVAALVFAHVRKG